MTAPGIPQRTRSPTPTNVPRVSCQRSRGSSPQGSKSVCRILQGSASCGILLVDLHPSPRCADLLLDLHPSPRCATPARNPICWPPQAPLPRWLCPPKTRRGKRASKKERVGTAQMLPVWLASLKGRRLALGDGRLRMRSEAYRCRDTVPYI